ncbi:MAG TPA: hypothetical protein VFE62_02470 [Gemmataceae bacterium]|nr:hypothetical protein [Gemmataceae bacterium]
MKRVVLLVLLWLATAYCVESKPARPPVSKPEAKQGKPALDKDVIVFEHRSFRIPFQLSLPNPDAQSVRLFVSEDAGKNWKKVDEVNLDNHSFRFHATRDGLFWFAAQTVDRNGVAFPAFKDIKANLKVYIDTTPRMLGAQMNRVPAP